MKKCILKCFKSSSKNPQDSLKSQSILKTESENPDLDLKQSSIKIPSIENENLHFLIKSLKNLPIFRGLQKTELINSSCFFRRLTFSQNKEIISEGDEGNFLYILITGACKVIKNQSEVSTLKPGSVFGELSLLTNQKRKTTVKTVTQSTLYTLDKLSFKSIFSVVQAREQESFEQMFKASPFFASLTSEQKKKIFEISFFGKFKEKEKICSEGEEALFVYFLLRGRVDVLVENRVVGTIEENHLFGEISLFNPFAALRAATIISKETCEVFLISINELILILGPDYRKVLLKNIVFNCMMTENLLNFLPIELIHHIANSFNFQEFSKESLVINSAVELDSTIVVVCFGKIFSMKKKFRSYSLIGLKNLKHLKVGTGKFKSEGFSIVGRISFEKVSEIIGCEERNLLEYLGKLAELKSVRFLNGLEFRDLDFVLRKVEREQFERGEVIFNDGCHDEKVYIVDTGAVGVFEEESFLSL
jgi:cAMP-dependent protein kinase regulator